MGQRPESSPSPVRPLDGRARLVVALMLFSMFFGAGNLILPPLLGLQAGTAAVPATVGFLVSGIGLPVLAVVAVALAGDARALAGRVSARFSAVFVALVYLSIGPLLAIPRTSSTAFEMLSPLLPDGSKAVPQLVFSVAFFSVAFAMALRPGRLSRFLGRVTGPALVALIAVLAVASLVDPLGVPGPVQATYAASPAVDGFVTGYQTMDLLAAMTFGLVVAENLGSLGVADRGAQAREVSLAGLGAGALLAVIYCAFSFLGATMGTVAPGASNGAEVLTAAAYGHFGTAGVALVAAIFLLACLNVCVGLVSCCGTYFFETYGAGSPEPGTHRLGRAPYVAWAAAFAAFSCVVSNVGLTQILALSVPLLEALYPPAIVLVLMAFGAGAFDRRPWCWPAAVGCAAVLGVAQAACGALAPGTPTVLDWLPLAGVGLGWAVPTAVVLGVTWLLSPRLPARG